MIDSVIAIFERYLAIVDPERSGCRGDVFKRTGQTDDTIVERVQIGRQLLRCVAFRVHGDEDDIDLIRVTFQRLQQFCHGMERGRADFGAVGEAEKYECWFAAQRLFRDRSSVLVDQGERAADSHFFHEGLLWWPGREKKQGSDENGG